MSIRRLSYLCVVLLLAMGAEAARRQEPTIDSRVSPQLAAALASDADRFHVIVHVAAADEAFLPLSASNMGLAERIAAVKQALAEHLADNQAKSAPAAFSVRQPFVLQPAYAASVNRHSLEGLLQQPDVRFIEEDELWPVHTAEGMSMIKADVLQLYGITGEGQAIAIIDTGVDYLHPALGGGPIPNVKVVHGLDTGDLDDDPYDCSGHGTAVASIAAGAAFQWSPPTRFAGGVAPDAKILAYKASSDSACEALLESAVVAAIEDAVLHREGDDYSLAAINISAGAGAYTGPCDGPLSAYAVAINSATEAGVAVVASSGNDGLTDAIAAPACLSNVISVGSVWDSPSGYLGYSFCLDDGCTRTCNDDFSPERSVTCYSNSSDFLDLLAPSEQLKVAEAGGETALFGGTSGAAPYVSGAIALIREAYPGLTPMQARFLLQLSGTLVMDAKNRTSAPLVDLTSAVDLTDIVISDQSSLIGTADGIFEASLWLEDDELVGELDVMIKLAHPRPSSLRIALTGPDGTTVLLHDHGAGTTLQPNGFDRFGGVFASYPSRVAPAESLDAFADRPLRGLWVLEIVDDDFLHHANTNASLLGWAIRYKKKEPPLPSFATTQFLPVVARASGLNGTDWVTDVRLYNPSEMSTAEVSLYFIPSGSDGHVDFQQRGLSIAPGRVVNLPDVVHNRFGMSSGQGQLIIQTDMPFLVGTERIYTSADPESGTFGQFGDSVSRADATSLYETPLYLLHLTQTERYRTNIGLSELCGDEATVAITLYEGATGAELKSLYTQVRPYSQRQINQILDKDGLEMPSSYATIRVVEGSACVAAYASVIDNLTGDGIMIPAQRPIPCSSEIIPVVAKTEGALSTDWTSEVRILNSSSQNTPLHIEYRPQAGSGYGVHTVDVEIQKGKVFQTDDVLGELFGLADGIGSLRVVSPNGPSFLVVTSRTLNTTADGTYGQFINGVSHGFTNNAILVHVDRNDSFRTNVGLCEVGGGSIGLRLTLTAEDGRPLATSDTIALGPFEMKQINDVFKVLEVAPHDNCSVRVTQIAGSGAFVAYASVVDAQTGDAMFVPARFWLP